MIKQDLFQNLDGGLIPTSPLQMKIRKIRFETALLFYKKWHYLGDTIFLATINYGAYFSNILRGVISYGSPNATEINGYFNRHTQNGWFEIKRLAMDDKAPKYSESRFIGVSIKLLKKIFMVIGINALADDSIGHKGIIYKESGFKYLGLTKQKKDFWVGDKIQQRGKTKGILGIWKDRSQKNLYIKKFI